MNIHPILPILLMGFLSSILGVASLTWITINFGFAPLNYWANLVIPIGAILSGTLCALGFGVSARLIEFPTTDALYHIMLAIGVLTFIVLLLAQYYAELISLGLQNDSVNFNLYISQTFSNGKMVLNSGSSREKFDIGLFGLLFGFGKFAGFVSGYGFIYSATRHRENIARFR